MDKKEYEDPEYEDIIFESESAITESSTYDGINFEDLI